ncbi:MAG TPA: TFIIB-type zinc ribbon-containing protein [Nitrososphaera sp.]|jgi:transcription initiation factor TFIIB
MKTTSVVSCICGADQQLVTDVERGEIVCTKCGLVSPDRVAESRAEWRTFDSEKNERVRAGSPTSLAQHDMGLSTTIGKENIDSSGRHLDASVSMTINRLRTWDFRSKAQSSKHRSLIRAFTELGGLKGKLGLSDAIIEKTAYVYRKAQEKRLVRGRSISSMLAAAIYASCREMGAPRSLRDIAAGTEVKRKDISRSYRILVLELDIKVPLVDPMKCIAKIANQADISEKTKRAAMKTMNELVEQEISAGKLPMGLAATVLYMSCLQNGEIRTQRDIAEAAGVTEVTVRNRFNDLKHHMGLD